MHALNPGVQIFPICAKTGEGVDAFCGWLTDQVRRWKGEEN